MKDKLLDSTIDGISDSLKDENSGRIKIFTYYMLSLKLALKNIVESFQEVCKYAKRLENIITLIQNFSLILANERHIKDILWTRKISFDDIINNQLLDGTIDRISDCSKDVLLNGTINRISNSLKHGISDRCFDSTIHGIIFYFIFIFLT